MDLREELLDTVTALELEEMKVISIEAVKAIVKRYDEERLQFSLAVATARFGGDES